MRPSPLPENGGLQNFAEEDLATPRMEEEAHSLNPLCPLAWNDFVPNPNWSWLRARPHCLKQLPITTWRTWWIWRRDREIATQNSCKNYIIDDAPRWGSKSGDQESWWLSNNTFPHNCPETLWCLFLSSLVPKTMFRGSDLFFRNVFRFLIVYLGLKLEIDDVH